MSVSKPDIVRWTCDGCGVFVDIDQSPSYPQWPKGWLVGGPRPNPQWLFHDISCVDVLAARLRKLEAVK